MAADVDAHPVYIWLQRWLRRRCKIQNSYERILLQYQIIEPPILKRKCVSVRLDGLLTDASEEWLQTKKNTISISEDEISSKIAERNKARDEKNYELADKIMKDLLDKGILIEDKNGTTSWKLK